MAQTRTEEGAAVETQVKTEEGSPAVRLAQAEEGVAGAALVEIVGDTVSGALVQLAMNIAVASAQVEVLCVGLGRLGMAVCIVDGSHS